MKIILLQGAMMPLITPINPSEEKEPWRIRLRSDICEEVLAYCQWAGIKYRDYFIEQACSLVFNTDQEWREFKASSQKNKVKKTGRARPAKKD